MNSLRHMNPTLQFSIPVIFETVFSTFINLVFSSIIGGISGSSLTVISQCNLILNFIVAATTMLTTGSSVLCARLLGAGEPQEASRVVEQTLFLALVSSTVITLACLIFTTPILTLLMPNAEPALLAEGETYFRVLVLSLPFLMATNSLVSVLRAAGDSRTSMIINVFSCVLQLVLALLFLRVLSLDIAGAGLTYLVCRISSMLLAFYALRHSHRFSLRLRNTLRANAAVCKRILSVGVPTSIESIFVQAGYLTASSMVIGLGSFEAAVYNVANTMYSFASVPQSFFAPIALTVVGQLIGAKEYTRAKKTGWKLWRYAILTTIVLSVILFLLRTHLTPLYSADPAVQTAASSALFAALMMNIPGISLNTLDPQLRAGGDVKFVMFSTIVAVWLIRLPLTYLFCYVWNWGASGAFMANAITLYFRMLCNMLRFIQGKYLYMRV